MHDNRVTRVERVTALEFKSLVRKKSTAQKNQIKARRKAQRDARKANR